MDKKEKAPRVPLTKADLEDSLRKHITALMAACKTYDDGTREAAMHIALSLRTLLHHNPKGTSKALLEQLGLRSERFYNSAPPYSPENLLTTSSLTAMKFGPDGGEYYAPLSDRHFKPKKVPFADWWNETVIADNKKRLLSRREIVAHVADTEAGHVDPTLDEIYMDLTRNNSLGWMIQVGDIQRPIGGPELACMRQIAHEVLITLQGKRPQCFVTSYTA